MVKGKPNGVGGESQKKGVKERSRERKADGQTGERKGGKREIWAHFPVLISTPCVDDEVDVVLLFGDHAIVHNAPFLVSDETAEGRGEGKEGSEI